MLAKEASPARQEAVRRFQTKAVILFALRTALVAAAQWTFLWGTAVLAMRAASGGMPLSPWWGAAAALPILGAALWTAWRRKPEQQAVRALIDRRNLCGGLLTASAERDIGVWRQKIPSIEVPRLRWDWRRPAAALGMAAAFLAGALTIPLPSAALPTDLPLQIGKEVEELTQKIEALEEEEILEEKQAQEMRQQLGELREQAAGDDPMRTWEALDHMENQVQEAARQAAQEAIGATEKLAKAEVLAKGMAEGASQLPPEQMSEASQELSSLLGGTGNLPKGSEGLNASKLNADQLRRLADRLHRRKKQLQSSMQNLGDLDLVKYETLQKLKEAGQCNSSGLAAYLSRNANKASVSELLGVWARPGSGGIDRGRADAPLTRRDDFVEEGYDFKELTLPPASLEALADSQAVGLSQASPGPTTGEGNSQGGALSGAAAGGGSAATRTIEPRHRGAVKRYFERGKN